MTQFDALLIIAKTLDKIEKDLHSIDISLGKMSDNKEKDETDEHN